MQVRLADDVEAVLADRVLHGLRHQLLQHLAANLILKARADDRARRMAAAKAGHGRELRVAVR